MKVLVKLVKNDGMRLYQVEILSDRQNCVLSNKPCMHVGCGRNLCKKDPTHSSQFERRPEL